MYKQKNWKFFTKGEAVGVILPPVSKLSKSNSCASFGFVVLRLDKFYEQCIQYCEEKGYKIDGIECRLAEIEVDDKGRVIDTYDIVNEV